MRGLVFDLLFSFRGLVRSPGFTVAALAVLAIAVAANTAVFALVRGTLLERPPYRSPESLVLAWGSEPVNGQLRDVISGSNFIDLRRRTTSLEALAAFHGDDVVTMRDGRPDVMTALQVTVDFLQALGVRPALGADFSDADRRSGAPPAAIISHHLWRDGFGGQADVIGRAIDIDGALTTIRGVLPEGFRFAGDWALYLPLRDDDLAAEDRTHHHYHMVGRLQSGVGVADASNELSAVMRDISASDPRLARWSVLVEPLLEVTVEAVRPALWMAAGAALLVVAVTVVNLGILLRVRTAQRVRELAVRAALGASRARVVSTVLVEALILASGGAAAGVLLAPLTLDVLSAVVPPHVLIPNSAAAIPMLRASLGPGLLGIAFAVGVMLGVLLAAPSLWLVVRQAPTALAPQASGRITASSGWRWMIGAELALATLLAVAAGLTLRSVANLSSQDLGVEPEGVLTTYFGNVEARPVAARAEYFRLVLAAVEAVPGVVRAGIKDYRPFEGEDDFKGIRFPDRPPPPRGQGVREEWRRVSEGYLQTAGMRMVRGAPFAPADFVGTPRSAVINQAFAAKHYPGQDPVGRTLFIAEPGYTDVEIVGVVADVRSRGVAEPAPPVVYVPYQASPRGHVALFVKTRGNPAAYVNAVRDAIWSVDAGQPVLPMIPFADVIARSMAVPVMTSQIVGAMAIVALMLAGIGVFGVVAYAVRTRRHDLAVRLALGAPASRLTIELVADIVRVLILALAAGLAAAALALGGLRTMLYGVTPWDPMTFAVASTIVSALAATAAYVPARRVVRLDPARVIREARP